MHGYVRPGNSQPAWLFPFVVIVVLILSVLPLARLATTGIARACQWRRRRGAVAIRRSGRRPTTRSSRPFSARVISLVIGCAFAFVLTLTDIRGKGALSFLFVLPMMIPPQVTALAWVQMSGPSSPLLKASAYRPAARLAAAALFGRRHCAALWRPARAAGLSGAAGRPDGVAARRRRGGAACRAPRSLRVFRDIILPLSLPGIIAGAAISFVSCTGNFGIPAILGIPASIYTLPTLIFTKFSAFTSRTFGDVALLSAIIAIISVVGTCAFRTARCAGATIACLGSPARPWPSSSGGWRFLRCAAAMVCLFFMLAAPFFALLAGALVPGLRRAADLQDDVGQCASTKSSSGKR